MSEYKAGLNPRCVSMSYYDTDRLQTESVFAGLAATGPPTSSTTYAYDEMGNRKSRQVAEGATTTYTYSSGLLQGFSDTTGRSVSFTHNGNGNRTRRADGSATDVYTYDTENRLTSLSHGGTQYSYLYDYRTRRVNRTEGDTSTQVISSGGTSV